jgi:hypothetical protein
VHLADALGSAQIAQPVLSEIEERHALRRHLTSQIRRRVRTQNLTTMGQIHHARRPVHRRPEVVALAQLRHPGVQTDPHPEWFAHRPLLAVHRQLAVDRGAHYSIRGHEHRVHAVAATFHHLAAVAGHPRTQDRVMTGQRCPHRFGLLIPQARRDLEVREQG